MKKLLYILLVPMLLGLSIEAFGQTDQKELCKSFMTTPNTYQIASVYAMGQKMFYDKGESWLKVSASQVTIDIDNEPENFPIGKQLLAVTIKKGKDPIYAFQTSIPDLGEAVKDKTYMAVTEKKGKKIFTIFIFNGKKKLDVMEIELY